MLDRKTQDWKISAGLEKGLEIDGYYLPDLKMPDWNFTDWQCLYDV